MPTLGFFTSEIKQMGQRVGFAVETFSKPPKTGTLAHVNVKSAQRVGKYGVNVDEFEQIVLPELQSALSTNVLVAIDEIGKMELISSRFREMLVQLFESDSRILASILYIPHPFCDRLKSRPDVELVAVNKDNRVSLVTDLGRLLS